MRNIAIGMFISIGIAALVLAPSALAQLAPDEWPPTEYQLFFKAEGITPAEAAKALAIMRQAHDDLWEIVAEKIDVNANQSKRFGTGREEGN